MAKSDSKHKFVPFRALYTLVAICGGRRREKMAERHGHTCRFPMIFGLIYLLYFLFYICIRYISAKPWSCELDGR